MSKQKQSIRIEKFGYNYKEAESLEWRDEKGRLLDMDADTVKPKEKK